MYFHYIGTIPATFNGQSTMLQYSTAFSTTRSTKNTISLSVRTRQSEGVLLHIRGAGTLSAYYMTLQLHPKFNLVLRYDLSGFALITAGNSTITDGKWHNLTITVQQDSVSLMVDATKYSGDATQPLMPYQILNGTSDIYVGGVPAAYASANSNFFQGTPVMFKGCMQEVRADGVLLPYFAYSEGYNSSASRQFSVITKTAVKTGCHGDPVCDQNLCVNGAVCVDVWNKYACNCTLGFNGTYCGNNIDDCVFNDCQNGAACMDGIAEYTCDCAPGFTDDR